MTAAEFGREPSRVRRAAANEPALVAEHGRPSVVVMSYAVYAGRQPDRPLGDWLRMDDDANLEA
ncbi:MAG: type II toxin-antitoxin system prevent-host-death family antitoxin [Bifidobacteriaceae bacterium]|nr:type II toxin-antitoxin system prevent-host-death family antitoxin [Bifidobacteriaceae bacterium]